MHLQTRVGERRTFLHLHDPDALRQVLKTTVAILELEANICKLEEVDFAKGLRRPAHGDRVYHFIRRPGRVATDEYAAMGGAGNPHLVMSDDETTHGVSL